MSGVGSSVRDGVDESVACAVGEETIGVTDAVSECSLSEKAADSGSEGVGRSEVETAAGVSAAVGASDGSLLAIPAEGDPTHDASAGRTHDDTDRRHATVTRGSSRRVGRDFLESHLTQKGIPPITSIALDGHPRLSPLLARLRCRAMVPLVLTIL